MLCGNHFFIYLLSYNLLHFQVLFARHIWRRDHLDNLDRCLCFLSKMYKAPKCRPVVCVFCKCLSFFHFEATYSFVDAWFVVVYYSHTAPRVVRVGNIFPFVCLAAFVAHSHFCEWYVVIFEAMLLHRFYVVFVKQRSYSTICTLMTETTLYREWHGTVPSKRDSGASTLVLFYFF